MRKKGSLSYSESVTYARARAGDERHQIAINARDSFDGFWNRFPTFWSAEQTDRYTVRKKKVESGICTAQVCARARANTVTGDQGKGNNAYLNSSASSPHKDFSL
jgi:hypothetical protein